MWYVVIYIIPLLFPSDHLAYTLLPMPTVLTMPRPEVTQADLENVLTLQAQIGRYQELLEHVSLSILSRVIAGAPIEGGRRDCVVVEQQENGMKKLRIRVT